MAHIVLKLWFSPVLCKPNHYLNNAIWYSTNLKVLGKQSKVLAKLMKDKNKHWHLTFTQEHPKKKEIFEKVSKPSRRVHILNALFMQNITDVLSTGEIGSELLGYGIEILNVQVTHDYQKVKVLWQLSGDEDQSSEVEKILNSCSYKIRSELIRRNVLGKVPNIVFIKDRTYFKVKELESVLKIADFDTDFGEDDLCEKPFKIMDKVSEEQVASENMTNEDTVMQPAAKEGDEIIPAANISDAPLNMRSDVLGLDHAALMRQVLNKMKKSKGYLKNEKDALISNTETLNQEDRDGYFNSSDIPAFLLIDDERKEKFKTFLRERNLQMKKNSKKQKDILESELAFSQEEDVEEVTFEHFFGDDYFEEETNNDYK